MKQGMDARQRKIVLALSECWEQNGKEGPAPSVAQIGRASKLSEMTVYNEIYELSKLGMVVVKKLEGLRADYQRIEARLTTTAEGLLPRIKELE
jgi:hypothetical protein